MKRESERESLREWCSRRTNEARAKRGCQIRSQEKMKFRERRKHEKRKE